MPWVLELLIDAKEVGNILPMLSYLLRLCRYLLSGIHGRLRLFFCLRCLSYGSVFDIHYFGLLCSMRMLSSCIHKQIGKQTTAQTIFGQHTFYRHLNQTLWLHVLRQSRSLSAGESGMTQILFVVELTSRHHNMGCIDHNHIVTAINMRRIRRLVFATDNRSNLRGHTA